MAAINSKFNPISIRVNITSREYELFYINPEITNNSLYIQFVSTDFKRKMPVIKDGKVIEEQLPICHLSFHKDGQVHIRCKDNKYKKICSDFNPYKYNLQQNEIIPIWYQSFYFSSGAKYFREASNEFSNHTFIIQDNILDFSVLMFLVNLSSGMAFNSDFACRLSSLPDNTILIAIDSYKCIAVVVSERLPNDISNGYMNDQMQKTPISFDKKMAKIITSHGHSLPTWSFIEDNFLRQ